MSPQEVALKLTEAYFQKINIDTVLNTEFNGKTTLEAYSYVFDEFFKQASKNINENAKNI